MSILNWWKKKKWEKEFEHALEQSSEMRRQFWKTIGEVDDDILTHLINPIFTGGPKWPATRQGFMRIQKEETVILASDGLSDPFDTFEETGDNEKYNGYGLEFYIECDDPILRDDLEEVKRHWAFQLLYEMSQNAANAGNIISLFQKYKILSIEFSEIEVPEQYLLEDNMVGVLLGVPSPSIKQNIELPYEQVQLVSMKVLTKDELQYILEYGAEGRLQLAEKCKETGSYHVSFKDRISLV
ncbi:hypothetical protein CON64_04060 [Bacillus pseudomycoides]|nr:hypothetical protein CON64_04060 [Bacillus pseudomycoides]